MKVELVVMAVGLFVMFGLIMGLTPFFSRKNIFYGVTIPETFQKAEKLIAYKKHFLWWNLIAGVLIALPVFWLSNMADSEKVISLYLTIGIFGLLLLSGGLFLWYRQKVITYKSTLSLDEGDQEKVGIIVDTNFRKHQVVLSNYLLIGSNLAIVLLVIVLTSLNYQRIPNQIITKWDFNGTPVQWMTKSWRTIFMLPVLQIFMMMIFGFANYSFKKARPSIDFKHPEVSVLQNQAFRYAWSVMMLVISLATQLLFALIQFGMMFDSMSKINFPVVVVFYVATILIGSLYLSFKYGQSGSRYKVNGTEIQTVSSYDEDQQWKLGVFYFNPEDPGIWVEKRVGIGTTMNMARWQSWVFLLTILIVPILITFLLS